MQSEILDVKKDKEELESRSEERLRVTNMQRENVQKLLDETLQQKLHNERESEQLQQTLQTEVDDLSLEVQQVLNITFHPDIDFAFSSVSSFTTSILLL